MIWLLSLLACGGEAVEESTCETLCSELVQTCEYGAFPTYESCEQGCMYNASKGADVDGEEICIDKAACDTFAILECEHKFGLNE